MQYIVTLCAQFPLGHLIRLVSLCISNLVVELPCVSKEKSVTDLNLELVASSFFFKNRLN